VNRIIIKSCLLVLGCSISNNCLSQKFDPDQVNIINYTLEDGLPSNECHEILQDSLGYIWIATDRGLVKYDGYIFKSYGTNEGLNDISCINLIKDPFDNIWILTLSGQVYMYNYELDSCILYKYQESIDENITTTKVIDFAIDSSVMVLVLDGIGFLQIDGAGNTKLQRSKIVHDIVPVSTHQVGEKYLITTNDRGKEPRFPELPHLKKIKMSNGGLHNKYILYHIENTIEAVYDIDMDNSNKEVFRINDSLSIVNIAGVNYYFNKDSLLIKKYKSEYEDLIQLSSGEIISAELNQKGINFYKDYYDLIDNKKLPIIKKVSGTAIIEDLNENVWITTTNKGLFKVVKNKVEVYSSNKKNSKITNIERYKNGFAYVVDKNEVIYRDFAQNEKKIIFDSSNRISMIKENPYTGELIICKNYAVVINEVFEKIDMSIIDISPKEAFVLSNDEILLSSPTTFSIYKDLDSLPLYYSWQNENSIRVLGAAKISDDEYVLGTHGGLKLFSNNNITSIPDLPDYLQIRINEIRKVKDKYLFATQGNGLVIYDLRNDLLKISTQDGLVSNNIENIFVNEKDEIFLSTKSGLSKISFEENENFNIRNYTTFHGLPSNEVNDVTECNDTIYIATGKGIAQLYQDPEIARTHKVLIEGIAVNGNPLLKNEKVLNFNHSENNLSIWYKTIDHSMHSKIQYRYRINDKPWNSTYNTSTNLSSLQPDDYNFEIQSKNIDDIWSSSTNIKFTINKPWWKTWWFYALTILFFSISGYFIYKKSIANLLKEANINEELRNLEKSALQAQMNPHFIFNCLNSIQSFIIQNDKEKAMDFLSRFAKLIRKNLNASVESIISLDDEIAILDNYLALEQTRLEQRFEYSIILNPSIDRVQTRIPPMLIQPFVENAVIHGMKNRSSEGEIDIFFDKDDHMIKVIVQDNGINKGDHTSQLATHRSYGTSITQKRLEFIQAGNSANYQISTDIQPSGTTVIIFINPLA